MEVKGFFFIVIITLFYLPLSSQIAVNTDGSGPDNSAVLDVNATNKGFLPPRLTTSQRDAIVVPADGLIIYNTEEACLEYYSGGYWNQIFSHLVIPTITNPYTGKTWMDRNLGAAQAAVSADDALAYGDLYQWGRLTDGHEKRNSGTTSTLSTTDIPDHSNFIIVTNPYPEDWRDPQNDGLWQGVNGVNNPCPRNFRIPTSAEWQSEKDSWVHYGGNSFADAAYTSIKLTVSGFRRANNGVLELHDHYGFYASSSIHNQYFYGISFPIDPGDATIDIQVRGFGYSVRCIQD